MVEQIVDGGRTVAAMRPGKMEQGAWYDVKLTVAGDTVTVWLGDQVGTIEVGKSAYLMILNLNLRTATTDELEQVGHEGTFFEGEKVFETDAPTSAHPSPTPFDGHSTKYRKFQQDGQLLIKHGNAYYNAAGIRMR